MKTIKLNSEYTLKVRTIDTGTNSNLSASIYEKGAKLPICGTIFSDSVSINDIKDWAYKRIVSIVGNCNHLNSYHFHDNAPRYCPDCKKYIN